MRRDAEDVNHFQVTEWQTIKKNVNCYLRLAVNVVSLPENHSSTKHALT